MTVGESFEQEKLTKKILDDVSERSDYWEKACSFITENWEKEVFKLSDRQIVWYERILEDLTEQRIEGKLYDQKKKALYL